MVAHVRLHIGKLCLTQRRCSLVLASDGSGCGRLVRVDCCCRNGHTVFAGVCVYHSDVVGDAGALFLREEKSSGLGATIDKLRGWCMQHMHLIRGCEERFVTLCALETKASSGHSTQESREFVTGGAHAKRASVQNEMQT